MPASHPRPELAVEKGDEAVDRVEVLGNEILVVELDRVPRLQEAHQLQHAGRIDDAVVEERHVVGEPDVVVPQEKAVDDELPHVTADRGRLAAVAGRTATAAAEKAQDVTHAGLREMDRAPTARGRRG